MAGESERTVSSKRWKKDSGLVRALKLIAIVTIGIAVGFGLLVLYMSLTSNWVYFRSETHESSCHKHWY